MHPRETRTNIVLDDELLAQAMKKAGVRTKKAAIEAALRAFVREPDWDFVLSMEGSQALAEGYDPAASFAADPDLAWAAAEPGCRYGGSGAGSGAHSGARRSTRAARGTAGRKKKGAGA